MSLILEALRKSEAQRRLGQAPDLLAAAPAPPPSRRRFPRWLLVALALMAVGAGAWWLGRLAVPDPANGQRVEAAAPVATGEATPRHPEAALPLSLQPEPEPAVAPATRQATPPRSTQPAPAPAPAVPQPPPEQAVTRPAPPPVLPLDAPAVEAATPAAVGTVIEVDHGATPLAALPAAERAALPELRVSMHLYAEEPDRRFAIVDGRRVSEGSLLAGSGVVEAITRDGLVVEFDGRRVLVPRP
ncbi:MAG: general secretion pathway protein GspB [Lysobacteraceae bacterium]